jgi:hypothetical protein
LWCTKLLHYVIEADTKLVGPNVVTVKRYEFGVRRHRYDYYPPSGSLVSCRIQSARRCAESHKRRSMRSIPRASRHTSRNRTDFVGLSWWDGHFVASYRFCKRCAVRKDQSRADHFSSSRVFRQVTEQCCEADSWLPADSDCREFAVDRQLHSIHEARFVRSKKQRDRRKFPQDDPSFPAGSGIRTSNSSPCRVAGNPVCRPAPGLSTFTRIFLHFSSLSHVRANEQLGSESAWEGVVFEVPVSTNTDSSGEVGHALISVGSSTAK